MTSTREQSKTEMSSLLVPAVADDETPTNLEPNDKTRKNSLQQRLPTVKTLVWNGGAVLPNAGSTARDHLANERTYLAWLRTGLALIGASLALLKWDVTDNHNAALAGYLVAVVGIVVLVLSTRRYFRVMQLLEQGMFEPNVQSVVVLLLVLVAAIVAAFVLHLMDSL